MVKPTEVFDVKQELQDALTAAIDRDCGAYFIGLPTDTTPNPRYLRLAGALIAEVEFYYPTKRATVYFDLKADRWIMRRD